MVATRNLKAGDIILREKAAVVGPSMEQSKAICVACAAPLTRSWHLCSVCQAPLCSKQCEKHRLHVDECKLGNGNGLELLTKDFFIVEF